MEEKAKRRRGDSRSLKRKQYYSSKTPLSISGTKNSNRYSLYLLMLTRNQLRSRINDHINSRLLGKADHEMLTFWQPRIFVEGKSIADLIEDSAQYISRSMIEKAPQSVISHITPEPTPLLEPATTLISERLGEDEINVDYELCLFFEEICQKMTELLRFLPRTRTRDKLQQILDFNSIYHKIRLHRESYINKPSKEKLESTLWDPLDDDAMMSWTWAGLREKRKSNDWEKQLDDEIMMGWTDPMEEFFFDSAGTENLGARAMEELPTDWAGPAYSGGMEEFFDAPYWIFGAAEEGPTDLAGPANSGATEGKLIYKGQPAMETDPEESIHASEGSGPGMNPKRTKMGLVDQNAEMKDVLKDWTRLMNLGAKEEPELIYKSHPAMETDPKELIQREASEGGDAWTNPNGMIHGDASAGVGSVAGTEDEGSAGNKRRVEGKITLHEEEVVGGGKISTETGEKERDGSSRVKVEEEEAAVGCKVTTKTEKEAVSIDQCESVRKMEEESLANYRRCWEIMSQGGSFEDSTLLSSMLFTHCTPGCIPTDGVVGRTFQVYSVKIAEINGLQWPLKVYGVVAARDEVDKHRNPLFLHSRDDCQILDREDRFLHLTGPYRAIVSEEPIEIEIQLRVNCGKKSDDKALISQVFYSSDYDHGLCSTVIENLLCKIELSYEQLEKSVQATIFGVHVAESSPFEYGVRVLCSSLPPGSTDDAVQPEPRQVELADSRHRKLPKGKCGHLNLSRQVVSVELKGKLSVLIQAYSPSGGIAAHGNVLITPQECNTSEHTIDVGDFEVKITVAWSLLVEDKTLISMTGYVDPLVYCPPMPSFFTEKLGLPEE